MTESSDCTSYAECSVDVIPHTWVQKFNSSFFKVLLFTPLTKQFFPPSRDGDRSYLYFGYLRPSTIFLR